MPDITFNDFLPQGESIRSLLQALNEGSLSHALLITGETGTGRRTLAGLIAEALLCEGEGEKPCGHCPACVQFRAGEHPDLITLRAGSPISTEAEKGRKSIPVSDIREMIRLTSISSYEGICRVVIVEDAENMQPPAQNALLKTLEEPPDQTYFILIAKAADLLLDTVVSRCRLFRLHAWSDACVRNMLTRHGIIGPRLEECVSVSSGSIGKALAVAADEAYWTRRTEIINDFFNISERSEILRITGAWKDRKDELNSLLDEIESIVSSLYKVRYGNAPKALLQTLPAPWKKLADQGKTEDFAGLMDTVHTARRMRISNVTPQAVLEQLLMKLMEEKSKWLR